MFRGCPPVTHTPPHPILLLY
uniref:Uncharacterized protein n=1 Tax=Anguilla anguilla TaxID=7936 RepID=A0A0E9V7P1_ANGAN